MSRNLYLLLPDGREPSGSMLSAFRALGQGSLAAGWDGVWRIACERDSVAMLTLLSGIAWTYPILVAFREKGDNRWSHATVLGRNETVRE